MTIKRINMSQAQIRTPEMIPDVELPKINAISVVAAIMGISQFKTDFKAAFLYVRNWEGLFSLIECFIP